MRSRGVRVAQRGLDLFSEQLALQLALGIGHGPVVGDIAQQVDLLAGGVDHHRLVFAAGFAPTQMVEAEVGHDAVDPGVEGTLEAEVCPDTGRP